MAAEANLIILVFLCWVSFSSTSSLSLSVSKLSYSTCCNSNDTLLHLSHRHVPSSSSRKAVVVALLVSVSRMLLERCSVCGLLEVLSAGLADDGLCCLILGGNLLVGRPGRDCTCEAYCFQLRAGTLGSILRGSFALLLSFGAITHGCDGGG